MDMRWKAGLVSLFIMALFTFFFPSQVQAQVGSSVSVSIEPKERAAKVGKTASFEVKVNNEGRKADTFLLKVSDDAGWGPMFENNLLEVPENLYATATLTVTIPENIKLYTEDNILVTAISQTDPTLTVRASCRAIAVLLGVEVSVLPSENIQPPGEVATFRITIKNIGESVDSYRLEVKEISFAGRSWEPTPGEDFFEDVTPGENRTTTLTARIPENAEEGDWSTIKVRVISQTDDRVFDFSSCTAKAPMGTNWEYFATGIGVVVAAGVIIAVLWKGPLAGG
ncbi:MAG: hypothetical protein ACE5NJ_04755 [Thermodesulfobacteriota bacterium]